MAMVNVLITGGAGFIGGSLAHRLIEDTDYQVVVVDNLSTGKLDHVPRHPRCRFIKCDVNHYQDIAAVMTSQPFTHVFHYAAVVGVQRTLTHPVSVLRDIDGLRNVLDLCKNTGVRRVAYSSSSEVYGEPVSMPQHEVTTPLNSRLPYAVVKNLGEAFCRSYQQEYDLNYTIFRFFNTYGPRQSTDFVMSRFLDAALAGRDLTVYGDGSQSRTFCYIEDNLSATLRAMFDDPEGNQVYNIGNDQEISVLELARLILKVTGSPSRIVHLPALKEGDMSKRQPDVQRMLELLGGPLTPLEEGLRRLLAARS